MNATIRRHPTIATLMLLAGCSVGTRPARFQPAMRPQGARTTLTVDGVRARVAGELLAVTDSGVTLVTDDSAIVNVRYSRIAVGAVRQVGDLIQDRKVPARETQDQLRALSRFPQGLNDDLLRQLLAALRLDHPRELP